MREIEVRLKRQKLADDLGDMREWLDQHDCVPVSFNIARGEGVPWWLTWCLKKIILPRRFCAISASRSSFSGILNPARLPRQQTLLRKLGLRSRT